MDKSTIFNQAHTQLVKTIAEIGQDNWTEQRDIVLKYISFIDHLMDLPESHTPSTEMVAGDTAKNMIHTKSESYTDINAYPLERKLRGGFLTELDVFVPETTIRSLMLENGDLIIPTPTDKPGRYHYELYGKNSIPLKDRISIDFCLVEKDGELLVVKQTLADGGKQLKYNDISFTFAIRDDDVLEFKLEEGDIIDIAYWSQAPEKMKVVWKHPIDDHEPAPMISGYYKEKTKQDKDIPASEHAAIKNKSILIIGCEPRKAIFKEQIEARGGNFMFCDGNEGKDRLESAIKKADIILLLTSFIRHQAFYDGVELCKKHNKLFSIVDGLGVKSIISGIISPTNQKYLK